MKETYRYFVNKESKHFTGKYYDFKCFKVYWSYRWYIAEQIDSKPVLMGTVNPLKATSKKDYIYTNYTTKYK